jgi:hypothetical protein
MPEAAAVTPPPTKLEIEWDCEDAAECERRCQCRNDDGGDIACGPEYARRQQRIARPQLLQDQEGQEKSADPNEAQDLERAPGIDVAAPSKGEQQE